MRSSGRWIGFLCVIAPVAFLGAACGRGDVDLPAEVRVLDPSPPDSDMERVETWSESVANSMIGFADKLRRRDFESAQTWLVPGFAGHSWRDLPVKERKQLPLASERISSDVARPAIVDRAGFLAGIAAHLGPWRRVEFALWKVKGAEFQAGARPWGKIRFKITFLGTGEDGGPRALIAWGHARALREGEDWKLDLFELTSLDETRRSGTLFTDVSVAAGVAHTGIRFGQEGNKSFAWNGAACGDADGDGLFDLFVPSSPRNFLYVATPSGGFVDRAEALGVARPAGGTGAVFLDFDNDGDQDLAVADVGWRERDGALGGNRLRLYVQGEGGAFVEQGAQLGFDALSHGYSVTALDFDSDGWLDLFVANYGRIESEPNDSWTDARNGTPDQLFRNVGGKRFEEVAKEVGIVDRRWGYACAAADHDGDGDQDLYVANDYGVNALWRNEGGRFTDTAPETGVDDLGNGMGAAWGDLDNDGQLDLYSANMSSTAGNRILGRLKGDEERRQSLLKMAAGNSIFLTRAAGEGRPRFELLPPARGGIDASWAWAVALADYDLDGRLDVFCVNGFITGDTPADT
ncbi:MAG: FG-GAP repeat domain-containing protein [Planctomycetota bacterium]